ncbi:hypothetical protein ACFQY5_21790 [Paeniroseomonas aquatica]|uniref:Uncharacterized protein n=1 Tax=Paeniroseomonas aquatica TaxID=373043 RepID=A0ABT8A218_9PROT|nr:hypothetical protein [Paeniroseomonas aquatica]MDN3563718.1 hypothetical protein [Paeniroseomonas aquatica]
MTRLKKLERDFATADIAAVNGLLAQLGDEDVMTRFGLEARLDELKRDLAALDDNVDEPTAAAALFFGGQPVLGSRGIESEFGGAAVTRFQDLVAKVLAHENGGLGQRGVVPYRGASTLHITNIVRGSFGFLFEEMQPQHQMVDTSLKAAIDETARLLGAFGEPDEEAFRTAVEEIDDRVLGTAREFFGLMRQRGATLRVVAGDRDNSFGAEAVARAADRASSTVLQDDEELIAGQLAGVLPDAHQFEFRAGADRGTLRGRIDRALTADQLGRFNRDFVNVDGKGRFHVKRVLRDEVVVRETYTLLGLEPSDRA